MTSNEDHAVLSWADAESLADLGELTARWLEGTLDEHPCYGDGPDPETESVREDLARLNRGGFVTEFSQPAEAIVAGSGQRAAVSGFCSEIVARKIAALGLSTDLIVLALPSGEEGGYQVPITVDSHRPFTWLGRFSVEEVEQFAESLGDRAVVALRMAWWVAVMDPKWGRQRYLWRQLTRVVVDRVASPFDVTPADEAVGDFVW